MQEKIKPGDEFKTNNFCVSVLRIRSCKLCEPFKEVKGDYDPDKCKFIDLLVTYATQSTFMQAFKVYSIPICLKRLLGEHIPCDYTSTSGE